MILYATYKHVFTLKEDDMYRYYILRTYFIICLFASVLILPYTVIENANARQHKQVSHNEFVNVESHKGQVHIVQGILDFSFDGKEKKINKDGVASRTEKKESKLHNTRTKTSISEAKGRAPGPRFLDGGPTTLRVPKSPKNKRIKAKRKKLSLPTWGDK